MRSQNVFEKKNAYEKLASIGQQHLLRFFESLEKAQQNNFLNQVSHLDIELYQRQKECLKKKKVTSFSYTPFKEFFLSGNLDYMERGKKLVKSGKTALVVMAGGQGSRLRFKGPKGCFPTSLIMQKTLFQMIAEKVKFASKQVGRDLEVAWMCSPHNFSQVKTFFIENDFFGLKPTQSLFFNQDMWPVLDEKGDLFLESQDQIGKGPNGNGGVFRCLTEANILEKWERSGIELVEIIPIDNPLASPFDYELLGFHKEMKCDVALRASKRKSPDEKVGILVNGEKGPAILEYSEIESTQEIEALANLGIYSFSLSFIKEASEKKLPLHPAKKAIHYLDERGEVTFPKEPNAWKFEEFIFDAFSYSKNLKILLSSREEFFAPLKNLEGEDSIEGVQAHLLARDRKVYERVTKKRLPPNAVLELSAEFYYPTDAFLEKWSQKELKDQTYID